MAMTRLKWMFLSKDKKLLYHIRFAKKHKQRLDLHNGVVLDFSDNKIYDSVDYEYLLKHKKIKRWDWRW